MNVLMLKNYFCCASTSMNNRTEIHRFNTFVEINKFKVDK